MIDQGNGNDFPNEIRESARLYLSKGLAPIPLRLRSKEPIHSDWPRLRVPSEKVDLIFPPGKELNIGVLNGDPSGNLVDVDLDSAEAQSLAPLFLPSTNWVFGRRT